MWMDLITLYRGQKILNTTTNVDNAFVCFSLVVSQPHWGGVWRWWNTTQSFFMCDLRRQTTSGSKQLKVRFLEKESALSSFAEKSYAKRERVSQWNNLAALTSSNRGWVKLLHFNTSWRHSGQIRQSTIGYLRKPTCWKTTGNFVLKDLTAKSKRKNYVSLMKRLYSGLSSHRHVPSVLS